MFISCSKFSLKNAYKYVLNVNKNQKRSISTTKLRSKSILSKFRLNEDLITQSTVESAFGYSHKNQKEKKITWNVLVSKAIGDVNELLSKVHEFAKETNGIESNNTLLNSFLNGKKRLILIILRLLFYLF